MVKFGNIRQWHGLRAWASPCYLSSVTIKLEIIHVSVSQDMWNKILTCFFLQEFQRTVLENVSRKVQAATMESQGLIQSAAPGVDTSGLEADQESLMDKWNSLNAKVNILGITVWSLCDIQSISTKYAS